jgi:hypothetical protein
MQLSIQHDDTIPGGPDQAAAIQGAIDRVHENGGGTVTLDPGIYRTTTIFLRSSVELHLLRGATLQAWPDLDAYPQTPDVVNNKDNASVHLLAAFDAEDVSVSGDGIIDGQDEEFWEPCRSVEDRPYGIFRYTVKGGPGNRPSPLVHFVRCRNVRIAGVTVTAAPGWAVHVFDCDVVSISGITVRGNPYGPNTDGIGVNGSRNVRVAHCDVDTGDDGIIIKSTNTGMACSNVTVTNCVVASNCAALGLGADVYGTISDVVFSNCVVPKSLRMIQVEMWYPGSVRRAVFSGISGRTFPDEEVENERPIYVDIQQHLRPEPELGEVDDMVFRDILCESRGRIMLTAQDGSRINGVTLDTVIVTVPEIEDPEVTIPRAVSMQLSNYSPETRAFRSAIVADNVDRLTLRAVEYRWPDNPSVPMHAMALRNVSSLIDESPRLHASHADVARVFVFPGADRADHLSGGA